MKERDCAALDDLELDALTELVNLGISQSATSLAGMVQDEVTLSVPKVSLVSREEAVRTMGQREARNLVAVHQIFEGDIVGRALLIFPEAKSLELVRAVVGGDLSIEEIIELEQEALAETGNVILNSCLATIANSLESNLRMSLPEVLRVGPPDMNTRMNSRSFPGSASQTTPWPVLSSMRRCTMDRPQKRS